MSLWIFADLARPVNKDLRDFNPKVVGELDVEMWKSYYEKRKVKLFFQLSKLLRKQFGAPLWRSYYLAYHAAKAAVVFQGGTQRSDYVLALPNLKKYFKGISNLAIKSFDYSQAAKDELEWWIIRRDPEYTTQDWEKLLAKVSANIYQLNPQDFEEHTRLRVEAMVTRDELRNDITSDDWDAIESKLIASWQSLHVVVNK